MNKKRNRNISDKGVPLFLSILSVFLILGGIVFSVSGKISKQMSASAISNLNESLDLIKCTIESILVKEAEFQNLIGQEKAKAVAAHGREIKEAGGKYCDCPACVAVAAILEMKEEILG